jgi:isoaspartyl peptidase/L-asparaginase-like protein (Ntn-hydrolase superfamily)
VSLALLVASACAATQDESDPFVPPSRPLIYGPKDECPSQQKKRPRRERPPAGVIGSNVQLATLVGGPIEGVAVVTHGGVGSPPALADGTLAAAKAALAKLKDGGPALDAAIEGVVKLEDDGRFNAGSGANIRLDGKTVEMDASMITSEGVFAAVAAIERVKNPILVAKRVLDTPHILLAGDGATRFAHKLGFKDETIHSKQAQEKYAERMQRLRESLKVQGKGEVDWRALWNFPNSIPSDLDKDLRAHGDTVGVVVRDRDGHFAATLSTGGTALTLHGRVGDVPIFGAGAFAGPAGAVACTGDGELIVKQGLARKVYEEIAAGVSAKDAVHRAVADFPDEGTVGVIALDRLGYAVAANRSMAFGVASDKEEE